MALENKLGITDSAELAREEERISKTKAIELFENGTLDILEAGKTESLMAIHKALFEDIYNFAGKLRTVNIAKGNFRFAPLMYLEAALENIDKMPQSTFDEIVEKSLRDAAIWDELKDRLKKSALGLSGGQQQRLCIARALAVQPEVILMDEPTSALDPISTNKIEDLVLDLKKDYTIIMVTHNMQQATRVSDNTAFFLLGEVIEFDKTEKLFSMPRDKRTEDYITGRFG